MNEYPVQLSNGTIVNMSYIGLNYGIDGKTYDNIASSYNKHFRDDAKIKIIDNNDIRYVEFGNVIEAYQLLRDEINSKSPRTFYEYVGCIECAITNYFGVTSDVNLQKKYYANIKKKHSNDGKTILISDLAHKNVATSVERAMLSQNFLTECGIDSVFKVSIANIDGKNDIHAYNLLKNTDKYYIFDSTIPSVMDGKINPIICEIPEDVYLQIANPNSDIGYGVFVSHVNSLLNKDCEVIYDALRDQVYKPKKDFTKKLV